MNVFEEAASFLEEKGFRIVTKDEDRPWGGFFVIDESQSRAFVENFFPDQDWSEFQGYEKLSPKFLIVAPGKRLSWQYHYRRSEIWRLIKGSAGVVKSFTDEESPVQLLKVGEWVRLAQGERHRLVGLDEWGVLAEIWQHTHPAHPSDEDDIVRLQDDFGR